MKTVVFPALSAAYLAILVFVALNMQRWGLEFKILILAGQLALLLPAIVWRYRRNRGETGEFPRFPALVAYCFTALPLAWIVNQSIYSGDESAYRFQARIFSAGHITAEAPAAGHGIDPNDLRIQHHLIWDNRWFGKYPPGWPAILAAGVLLHSEWLVNPLLGLLIVWLTYKVANRLFDISTGRAAALILVASPFFVLNCIDFLSHTACTALVAAAVWFFFAHMRSRRTADFAFMLAAIAMACLVRPYPSAWIALVLCAARFWTLRREPAPLLKFITMAAIAGGMASSALLLYNWSLTGKLFPSTYSLYRRPGQLPELEFSARNILSNLYHLTSVSIGETILTAFPLIAVLAGYALLREKQRTWEVKLLAVLFGVLIVGYAAMTTGSFSFIGERYYFETYFALAILAARGWRLLILNWAIPAHAIRDTVIVLLVTQAIQYAIYVQLSLAVRRPNRQVEAAIASLKIDNAVVFMKLSRKFRPFDLNLNPVNWKHAPLFCIHDPGAQKRNVITCALERSRWIVISYDDQNDVPIIGTPADAGCGSI